MSTHLLDPEIIEYERSLIGGCMADTRGVAVWPTLRPEEFLLDRHRLIWEAMLDLTEKTHHPTNLDVAEALKRLGHLDAIGGRAAIAEIVEAGAWVFDLARYGQVIRDAATHRHRIAFGAHLAKHPDISEADLERALRDLESSEAAPAGLPSESYRALVERLGREPGVATRLPALDARLGGGVMLGQVVVIGARTSVGKTAFSAWLARQLADAGTPVDYIPLEETAEAIHARWIASVAKVPLFALRQGTLSAEELERARAAAQDLDLIPARVTRLRSPYEARMIAAVASASAPVVFVDHLQHVITEGRSRVYELERVMARLSSIAVADRKLIFVAAQLSRSAEQGKKGQRPTLADLRDSGGIEQIARQVWLLYWPARYNSQASPVDYEINVAKNSEGPTGVVDVSYDTRTGSFS